MTEYIPDPSNPCRACKGKGRFRASYCERSQPCHYCGGSGCVSVMVERRDPVASSELVKNRDSVTKTDLVDDVAQGWPELSR